jgi:hypothetical protein
MRRLKELRDDIEACDAQPGRPQRPGLPPRKAHRRLRR